MSIFSDCVKRSKFLKTIFSIKVHLVPIVLQTLQGPNDYNVIFAAYPKHTRQNFPHVSVKLLSAWFMAACSSSILRHACAIAPPLHGRPIWFTKTILYTSYLPTSTYKLNYRCPFKFFLPRGCVEFLKLLQHIVNSLLFQICSVELGVNHLLDIISIKFPPIPI